MVCPHTRTHGSTYYTDAIHQSRRRRHRHHRSSSDSVNNGDTLSSGTREYSPPTRPNRPNQAFPLTMGPRSSVPTYVRALAGDFPLRFDGGCRAGTMRRSWASSSRRRARMRRDRSSCTTSRPTGTTALRCCPMGCWDTARACNARQFSDMIGFNHAIVSCVAQAQPIARCNTYPGDAMRCDARE